MAERLTEDFARDRADSREVTFEEWRARPIWERAYEKLGQVLERQQ